MLYSINIITHIQYISYLVYAIITFCTYIKKYFFLFYILFEDNNSPIYLEAFIPEKRTFMHMKPY